MTVNNSRARYDETSSSTIIHVNFPQSVSKKQRHITSSSPLQSSSNKKEPVSPIKSKKDIKKLKNILLSRGKYALRNWLLFVLGINIGLRCSDIVRFRFCDVLAPDGGIVKDLTVNEQKTGKRRYTPLNSEARKALKQYIDSFQGDFDPDDFLFPSNKKSSPHITVDSARDILKDAAALLDKKIHVGSHTLRKTFAYHFFMSHKNDNYALCNLQDMLNHASLRDTLRYIGLDRETKCKYVEDLCL